MLLSHDHINGYFSRFEACRSFYLRKKAREMIDKDWQIIKAIANKLFIHKTLEWDEWSIIIDAFDEGEDPEECFNKMWAINVTEQGEKTHRDGGRSPEIDPIMGVVPYIIKALDHRFIGFLHHAEVLFKHFQKFI